jgi:hypothetical protein
VARIKDVDWVRVLVGFHFRNSDLQGSTLGRKVGRYVANHYFQPLGSGIRSLGATPSASSRQCRPERSRNEHDP